MKRVWKALLPLYVVLLLCGCGAEKTDDGGESAGEKSGAREDYVFQFQGISISVNEEMEPLLEKLGEPGSYFEAPSCADQGMDKVYTYDGFEIYTSQRGEKDYISKIYFKDDIVKTAEGIRIGDSAEKVKEVYGEHYEEQYGEMSYPGEAMTLRFFIEDGSVAAIKYQISNKDREIKR